MAGSAEMRGLAARGAALAALAFVLGLLAANLWSADWHTVQAPARFTAQTASSGWAGVADQLGFLLDKTVPRGILVLLLCSGLVAAIAAVAVAGPHSLLKADAAQAGKAAAPSNGMDAAVTAQLTAEITSLLKALRSHLEVNDRYAGALGRANTSLGQSPNADQVWNIVKLLMAENDAIRADARELKTQLEVSHEYVDQLRSSLARAEEAALLDPLTGVGNRRRFDLDLAQAVDGANSARAPLCLVLSDLDNFKQINDRFGHPVGDEILRLFTGLLVQNVKGRDKIARFGGEEFAILLPNTSMGNAYHLTEQIRNQLQQAPWVGEMTGEAVLKLTASFGIAQLGDGDSASALLRRADAKLYEAKRNGRNQIVIERSKVAA